MSREVGRYPDFGNLSRAFSANFNCRIYKADPDTFLKKFMTNQKYMQRNQVGLGAAVWPRHFGVEIFWHRIVLGT